jgi:hypothetical protein
MPAICTNFSAAQNGLGGEPDRSAACSLESGFLGLGTHPQLRARPNLTRAKSGEWLGMVPRWVPFRLVPPQQSAPFEPSLRETLAPWCGPGRCSAAISRGSEGYGEITATVPSCSPAATCVTLRPVYAPPRPVKWFVGLQFLSFAMGTVLVFAEWGNDISWKVGPSRLFLQST